MKLMACSSLGNPRQLEDLLTGLVPSSKNITEQGGEKLALRSQDDLVAEELVALTLQCVTSEYWDVMDWR